MKQYLTLVPLALCAGMALAQTTDTSPGSSTASSTTGTMSSGMAGTQSSGGQTLDGQTSGPQSSPPSTGTLPSPSSASGIPSSGASTSDNDMQSSGDGSNADSGSAGAALSGTPAASGDLSPRRSAGGYSLRGGNVYGGDTATSDNSIPSSGSSAMTNGAASSGTFPAPADTVTPTPTPTSTPTPTLTPTPTPTPIGQPDTSATTGIAPANPATRADRAKAQQQAALMEECRVYKQQRQSEMASANGRVQTAPAQAANDPCSMLDQQTAQ